jgi:hypothetical protein
MRYRLGDNQWARWALGGLAVGLLAMVVWQWATGARRKA